MMIYNFDGYKNITRYTRSLVIALYIPKI